MRKLLALLMTLTLLCSAALAEGTQAPEAAESAFTPLPMDATPGLAPSEDCFTDEDEENGVLAGYSDPSITVTVEKVELNGVLYNVARVKVADASQLRTGLEHPKAKKTNYVGAIARKHNAIVAIGGDYFSKDSYGYVVRMGVEFRKKPSPKRDMLLIDSEGNFHLILKSDATELKALLESGLTFPNIFNFGPALVMDGELLPSPDYYVENNNRYNTRRPEPRCAIGQVGPLEYMLVVVDGRTKNSKGATCDQLAQFMFDQGCTQAYNLDGGDSAQMWFHGDYYSRETKRSVSDIIYFSTLVDGGTEAE